MRGLLLALSIILLCGFTTGYRNNAQTGKPDLVTTGVTVSEVSGLSGVNTGDVTLGTANGLSLSGQVLSLQAATNSVSGALTAADHTTLSTAVQPAGNVATATKLQTARTINGVAFDGSANIQTATANSSDYSSGAWTPYDSSGAGIAITCSNCAYVKFGGVVFITANNLHYPATSNASSMVIGGLPYPVKTSTYGTGPIVGATPSATYMLALGGSSAVQAYPTGSLTPATNLQMTNSSSYFSIVYQTN
jgi:hypothetical protein